LKNGGKIKPDLLFGIIPVCPGQEETWRAAVEWIYSMRNTPGMTITDLQIIIEKELEIK